MRKYLVTILLVMISFVMLACNTSDKPTVMVPSGSPQMAQIYLETSDNYIVDIVQGADPLVVAFGSKSHDFIFAPTNLGARMFQAKPDYLFICAVTFGNYYLITKTDNTFDINSLGGREITAFGANQTSDIIMKYVLQENDIIADIQYVDSVQTAVSLFVEDQTRVVLIAEPSLAVLESQFADIDIINLQSEYEVLTGESGYPQAGVFAKTTLNKRLVNNFLDALSNSVVLVNQDPDAASDQALALGYSYQKQVLMNAIPRCNLGYQEAGDVKADLEAYFTIIMDTNPNLIGGELPGEDFYYEP